LQPLNDRHQKGGLFCTQTRWDKSLVHRLLGGGALVRRAATLPRRAGIGTQRNAYCACIDFQWALTFLVRSLGRDVARIPYVSLSAPHRVHVWRQCVPSSLNPTNL